MSGHQWRLREQWSRVLLVVLLAMCLAVLPVSPTGGTRGSPGLSSTLVSAETRPAGQKGEAIDPLGYSGCGGGSVPVANHGYEQEVVELVNAMRANQSPPLPPLKRVPALDAAARYHAADMSEDNYFAHDTYDRIGESLTQICAWYDRMYAYYDGAYKGENIAGGFGSPQEVMNGWMNSPSHRAVILSGDYREIGVGFYQGSGTYVRYWAQDFGQRSDSYPLIVNGEAARTVARTVQLYIYGDWAEMRLRNDGGEWGAWEPFQSNRAWTLAGGTGDHTVYVELRSGSTTASSSDSIYLIDSLSRSVFLPTVMRTASP